MTGDPEILSEEEALRLWQHAAHLQAKAARRAEEARAAGDPGPEDAGEGPRPPVDGYALTHVRAAALETGIGEEFVEAALAEMRARRTLPANTRGWARRLSSAVLGRPPSEVARHRTVRASPERVLECMEAVLPFDPFDMTLDQRRGDPTRGGVLVFELQGVGFVQGAGAGSFKKNASYADLRRVSVTLTARGTGTGAETEITARSPVAWAWPINASFVGGFTAFGGVLGLGVGLALAPGVGLATAVVMTATGSAGAASGLGLMRAIYRFGMGRGGTALEAMLTAVALKAEGGWGIGSAADGPPSPPPPPG